MSNSMAINESNTAAFNGAHSEVLSQKTKANSGEVTQSSTQGMQNAADIKQIEQKLSEQVMDKAQLEKVAQQLQEFVSQMSKSVLFQVDEESGRDVIKVIDKQSGDVLKQYPSEDVLSLVAHLNEVTGSLINEHI